MEEKKDALERLNFLIENTKRLIFKIETHSHLAFEKKIITQSIIANLDRMHDITRQINS